MARSARIVAPGYPHYVAQEAREGVDLFPSDEARRHYLDRLAEACAACKVEIMAHALLGSSVHLLLVPRTAGGLGDALRRAHSAHSRRVLGDSGASAWRDRFRSCPLDKSLAPAAARHVERLAVEHGLARTPGAYRWSSAHARAGRGKVPFLAPFPGMESIRDYGAFLREKPDPGFARLLEAAASRGHALGPRAFLARLEKKLGRKASGGG